MRTIRLILVIASERSIAMAAIKVALVVGTILNLINQGGRLMDGLPISWLHLGLNYLVPYCVSSYSAARNQIHNRQHLTKAEH
ncbi:nitrate/nitrite transporter NrtS [Dechloromonas sp. ARDL1]|uniref:nitrate/nitrite transporter NrtS n=1 Tax=Dechloromonas sp. ARDL1 TaxID=3322121 RepID=UPI003DA6F3E6